MVQIFEDFNRRFFRGRLPRYRVRRRRLKSGGFCNDDLRLIVVAAHLAGDELDQVLLHEMCHHGIPGHGATFHARLQRVVDAAERGGDGRIAGLMRAELAAYRQRTYQGNEILRDLEDLALERPGTPWAKVRAYLVREFNLLPEAHGAARLLALARRRWERLRREAGAHAGHTRGTERSSGTQ